MGNKRIFIRFFFILYLLAGFARIEGYTYLIDDYNNHTRQIYPELVNVHTTDYNLILRTRVSVTTGISVITFHTETRASFKYYLLYFNNAILYSFKEKERIVFPQSNSIRIQEKGQIWHQSSEENFSS